MNEFLIAADVLNVRAGHAVCVGGREPVHAPGDHLHYGPVHLCGLRPVLAPQAPNLDGRGQINNC